MFNLFIIVGIISIIIPGIFIGGWTGGQQQRANFHLETEEHRDFRTKIRIIAGLIGIVSFGISGLIYFL